MPEPAAAADDDPTADPAVATADVAFRPATREDVAAVVALLADDDVAGGRPTAPLERYLAAFDAIAADPRQLLLVGDAGGAVVAVAQLTFLPHLTHGGAERCHVEGVRVRRDRRGDGLGRALLAEIRRRAEERGCAMVQLTTDRRRPDARRFYEANGFVATHEGMKLVLVDDLPV